MPADPSTDIPCSQYENTSVFCATNVKRKRPSIFSQDFQSAPHSSSYRGVSETGNRYQARIRLNGNQVLLGTYENEVEAAAAHDWQARKLGIQPNFDTKAEANRLVSLQVKKTRVKPRPRSGFYGVSKNGRRWMAALNISAKFTHVGTFDTKEEAALAYDRAARARSLMRGTSSFNYATIEAAEQAAAEARKHFVPLTSLRNKPASGYSGVSARGNRWVAQMRVNGKDIHIGTFDDAEDASAAHAKKLDERMRVANEKDAPEGRVIVTIQKLKGLVGRRVRSDFGLFSNMREGTVMKFDHRKQKIVVMYDDGSELHLSEGDFYQSCVLLDVCRSNAKRESRSAASPALKPAMGYPAQRQNAWVGSPTGNHLENHVMQMDAAKPSITQSVELVTLLGGEAKVLKRLKRNEDDKGGTLGRERAMPALRAFEGLGVHQQPQHHLQHRHQHCHHRQQRQHQQHHNCQHQHQQQHPHRHNHLERQLWELHKAIRLKRQPWQQEEPLGSRLGQQLPLPSLPQHLPSVLVPPLEYAPDGQQHHTAQQYISPNMQQQLHQQLVRQCYPFREVQQPLQQQPLQQLPLQQQPLQQPLQQLHQQQQLQQQQQHHHHHQHHQYAHASVLNTMMAEHDATVEAKAAEHHYAAIETIKEVHASTHDAAIETMKEVHASTHDTAIETIKEVHASTLVAREEKQQEHQQNQHQQFQLLHAWMQQGILRAGSNTNQVFTNAAMPVAEERPPTEGRLSPKESSHQLLTMLLMQQQGVPPIPVHGQDRVSMSTA
jgi:hypothetical protein